MVDRVPVQSSTIAEIGYDPNSLVLEVAFLNGNIYQYFDVPEAVFNELMHAESYGKYLNAYIKNNYRYVRL